MRTREATDEARMEAAAMWWAKFQECEPAAADIAAWLAWMEQDESNAQAFRSMNDLALRIRHTRIIAPGRWIGSKRASVPRRALAGGLAIAVCILAVIGMAWVMSRGFGPSSTNDASELNGGTYATSTGLQREVLLPDGSRVILGGASAIETEFSVQHRHVKLTAGEAYFEVQHDASERPFVVDVGIASVRAVGTAFNIRKNDARVAVTVTEGRVKVDRTRGLLGTLAAATGMQPLQTVELGRDEQVIIEGKEAPLTVAAVDPERAMSWRKGRLEFVDEPLDVVIDNVSRYSDTPLVAADPGLHAITYTGTFVPEHLESWLGALESVFPVQITREGEVMKVRARPDTR